MATSRKSKYHRISRVNRNAADIQLTVLNHLSKAGICSVTHLLYVSEINSKQKNVILVDMQKKGLVQITPVSHINPKKRGRHPNNAVARMHPCVKNVVSITALGRKYMDMSNRLDNMINWSK